MNAVEAKCNVVTNSCETLGQLEVALNYFRQAKRNGDINNDQYFDCHCVLLEKLKEYRLSIRGL